MGRSLLSPRLVGRDRELALVTDALGGDAAGPTVAVIGDAGVGKSALLRAATSHAVGPVLVGAASPGGPPLEALAQVAVAAVAAGADADHPSLDALRSGLAPLLGTRSAADEVSGAGLPALLAEALLALVATLAVPVTVVLDDLHWADQDTVLVCERLVARRAARRDLGLLVATRPGAPIDASMRRLATGRSVEIVDLDPLLADDVTEMVSGCLGRTPPGALLDGLAVCGGHPFFIEEHLRSAAQAGLLVEADGAWTFDAEAGLPVPPSVLDALRHRVQDLSPTTREVLTAAAALGHGVPVDAIAAAIGVDRETMARVQQEGESAQLLVAADGELLTFRHALTVDALASLVTGPERRSLAARASVELEARVARDPSAADALVLAQLAELAAERDVAARWRIEVARTLSSRAAVGPALEQYDQARRLAVDADVRVAARTERIDLLVLAGRLEEARVELDAVDPAVTADGELGARLAILQAQVHATESEVSRRWVDTATASAVGTTLVGHVLAIAALLEVDRGETLAAEELARRCLATRDIDATTRCRALEVLGRVARGRSLDEAARCFRQGAAVAEAHDLALWRARALHELATIRQLRAGDTAELELARAAAVACGAPGLVASVDFHIAAVLATAFDGHAALPVARRCVDLAGVLDDAGGQAWAWMLCGLSHLVVGDADPARAALAEADRRNPGDPELAALTRFLQNGFAPLLRGEPEGAADEHVAAMLRLAELGETVSPLPPWYLGPLLLAALDHPRVGEVTALADRDELTVVVMCRPTLLLARAVTAGRQGDRAAAEQHATEAFDEWAGKPATDALRHLACWLAAGPAATDGWGDPTTWLFEAEAWATSQGLPGVAANCRARLRSSGVAPKRRRSRTPVPPGLAPFGLTGREVDVLSLLPEGLSNAAIGGRLHIAPGTVKGYVENLLVKTGAANRAALATLAVEHGLASRSG